MTQIRKELVQRRFEVAAALMGWDIDSDPWVKRDGTEQDAHGSNGMKATEGHVSLRKAGRANRYTIIQLCNINGGQRTLHYSATGEEMVEYFDGLLAGAARFAPEAVIAAWAAANARRGQ